MKKCKVGPNGFFTATQVADALGEIEIRLRSPEPWDEDDWVELESGIDLNLWTMTEIDGSTVIGATIYPLIQKDGKVFTDTSSFLTIFAVSCPQARIHSRYLCDNERKILRRA